MNIINENNEKSKRYLPHELHIRENAVKTYRNGNSIGYVCRKYHISRTSLYRWNKQYDGTKESLKDKSHRPLSKHPNAHTDEEITWIKNLIRRNPDITLWSICILGFVINCLLLLEDKEDEDRKCLFFDIRGVRHLSCFFDISLLLIYQ